MSYDHSTDPSAYIMSGVVLALAIVCGVLIVRGLPT